MPLCFCSSYIHEKVGDTGVIPAMVPTQCPELLSTAYGLLLNELHRSPDTVLRGVQALLRGALALDTGAVCDIGALDFNTGVDIILYVTRLAARVDNFVSFLVQHSEGKHPCKGGPEATPLREIVVDDDCLARLKIGSASIRVKLHGEGAELLEEYLSKVGKAKSI